MIWQANITNIIEPFIQKVNTICWLDLSVTASDPSGLNPAFLGWKAAGALLCPPPYTGGHFMDDAVGTA